MQMQIGTLGNPAVVFKRKFRWTFSIADSSVGGEAAVSSAAAGSQLGHICKISSRPAINFDEQQVQHLIEVINLPAKAQWDSMEITVYDLEGESYLYRWLISFYNPFRGTVTPIAEEIVTGVRPKKSGFLTLLNGHGKEIEKWVLQGCWPVSINWGDLDYSSSDLATISFQLRYDRAILYDSTGIATGVLGGAVDQPLNVEIM